jgi:uncharacterized protein YcaQ
MDKALIAISLDHFEKEIWSQYLIATRSFEEIRLSGKLTEEHINTFQRVADLATSVINRIKVERKSLECQTFNLN